MTFTRNRSTLPYGEVSQLLDQSDLLFAPPGIVELASDPNFGTLPAKVASQSLREALCFSVSVALSEVAGVEGPWARSG